MEKRCSEGLSLLGDALMEESEGPKLATSIEISNPDDVLKSTKAKIGEVREENKKLKQLLERFVKDYQSLQKLFYHVLQQEQSKKSMKTEQTDDQMVSLCLGRTFNEVQKDEKKNIDHKQDAKIDGKLELALNLKFDPGLHEISSKNQSSETSFEEEMKEEDGAEIWAPPSKIMKTMKGGENEDSPLKKTRVSVRARCESSTMNDGCQWRKYGQKMAKGNPCPRAYYRCTVSPSCPVRKQVQRCVDDMSILITTYEGTHNHPLSLSATAMASATSAAADSSSISSTFSNSHPTINVDLTSDSKSLSIFSGSSSSSFQTPWNGNGRSLVQEHFYPPPYMNNNKQFSTFSATNPDFETALAAALKSVVRNGVNVNDARENHGGKEGFSLEFNGLIIKNDPPVGGLNQNKFSFAFTEH